MWTRGFIFFIGAFFIYTEVLHSQAQDTYVAELMLESNVTLETKTILTVLGGISTLEVTDKDGISHKVTFDKVESVAECLIVGVETSCNCSAGYIWSNLVCTNFNCCRETTCNQNVSYITPLCILKVPVYINGSVALDAGTWDDDKKNMLTSKFEELNGFESLNITGTPGAVTEFEVGLSVIFETDKLQDILNTLMTVLEAFIRVDTTGIVHIEYPTEIVCYKSTPVLKCTLDQATDENGWNMSTTLERFELNNGLVVLLDKDCSTPEFPSCVGVTLQGVTGGFEGTYECGFSKGTVRHIAKAYLSVARLPDTITLTTNPITGDCSDQDAAGSVPIKVTATIQKTNNTYTFKWIHNTIEGNTEPEDAGTNINYIFDVPISCAKVPTPQRITVSFKNGIEQEKTAFVDIPFIYKGENFCEEDIKDGELWPKTPNKATAVNNTCPAGRTGYKTCTCESSVWGEVFDMCVNENLDKIGKAAEGFRNGLGATQEVAVDIFTSLEVNTDGSSDNIADVSASIGVFDVMRQASEKISLTEDIFPSLVKAASNVLENTWVKVNKSVRHTMSSNYLMSVEGLVHNIVVNTSNNNSNFNSPNVDLKVCGEPSCRVNVFGVNVNMNKSRGVTKMAAIKNLMPNLNNNFKKTESTNVIVTITTEVRVQDMLVGIEFNETAEGKTPYCVFWKTDTKEFSDEGCKVKSKAEGNSSKVFCVCNHLTSFSVLMARGDVSNPSLDIITYVGLGVSIVSLVIFLIIEYLVWAAVVKTKLSHYRHTAMVNIAFFLLLADICFLASTEPTQLSQDTCLALTVCKHLFFLAKFCWMFCLSAMLVHQLIFVFNPLRKKVFMYLSSIMGYIVPILIVGTTYVYYKYTNKPYYKPETCWLTYESLLVGSLHAFVLPIGIIILSNIFSLGVVIVTLLKSSKNDSSKADEKDTAKSIIKVILVLAPVFGVTWSIGFCLVVFNSAHPAYPFFNYTFTIVNSFQGFFVLLTGFVAEQKVKDELYKVVTGNKKGSSDSTKNLTSTMYTKDK